eukprot:TRINITY_DN7020_c0_g5_i1.p1 TRINITY_DN7020_c0_g5~~TRINITY_DN7020_c0_g5_i1.p1  ORF type:complete len:887 (+),score=190.68 TRINITY_DN7020_c0_g5_i1:71-2662(+)
MAADTSVQQGADAAAAARVPSARTTGAATALPSAPRDASGSTGPGTTSAAAALWERFVALLSERGTCPEELLRANEAEIEDILTELGYGALERAQLRTSWYSLARPDAGAAATASSTVVSPTAREHADVRVLLERYVDVDAKHCVSVVEVERLQNPVLERRLDRRKTQLVDCAAGSVRRFHACVSAVGAKIQDAGFALPAADAQQQCLHFLTKAAAPFPPGAHKLLLCDVIVGKYKAVNGRADSVTREQLCSEGFDSVYLFNPAAPAAPGAASGHHKQDESPSRTQRPPDEFLIFHADQALPRYCVSFLVHPRWEQQPLSPRSQVAVSGRVESPPRAAVLFPPEAAAIGARARCGALSGSPVRSHRSSASLTSGAGGSDALRYWLVADNQLVSADSLLVGEHRGKQFITISEGAEQQMRLLSSKAQELLCSIDDVKQRLQAATGQRERQADERGSSTAQIRAQMQLLRERLDEKQAEVLRQVEQQMSAALGGMDRDCAALAGQLEKLEIYSQRVNQMLLLARSSREQFLLRSPAFLDEMEGWDPPYRFQPDAAVADLLALRIDVTAAQRSVAELQLSAERTGAAGAQARRSSPARGQHSSRPRPRSASPGRGPARKAQSAATSPPGRRSPAGASQSLAAAAPSGDRAHPTPRRSQAPHAASAGGRDIGVASGPRRAGRTASTRTPAFCVALVGDAGVGKTLLTEAWKGLEAPPRAVLSAYHPTEEPSSSRFTVVTSRGKLAVTIADLPGSQLCPEALSAADAAVIVFDCTDRSTYDNVSRWYSYLPYHVPVALCGNKSNETGRVVKSRDITFHKEVNSALGDNVMNYYDISVVSRYNVDKPWTWICRKLTRDPHLAVREIIAR